MQGEKRLTARLGTPDPKGKITADEAGIQAAIQLLGAFLESQIPTLRSPKDLASRMAHLALLIRDTIRRAFESEEGGGGLHTQMKSFQEVLLHDLDAAQFADMYAQTICYGLFAARCAQKGNKTFTRVLAPHLLPKTNLFLRGIFDKIAGVELDDRIVWAVDDLAELMNRVDIQTILKDFGKRTRQEDPVVHFYETFLAAYDPKLRESRGVYYTPEPVVSYIVRSVDHLLKTQFGMKEGLADATKVAMPLSDGTTKQVHKVQVLDPATGTGTFLHGVIDQIHESFKGNEGMWSSYVSEHLLPRLFGFELLMAPYAVAHLKLGLQLAQSGYDFSSDERLRIYLTNTLEEAFDHPESQPYFSQWLAEEAQAAGKVKREAPVMVVLGNPPYSGHSANTGAWIKNLLKGVDTLDPGHPKATGNYFEVDGSPLGERNPKWLNDDYVKFIRFAQWRIEQTGHGVLAFISNHGYLDNPTFRGMRQSLMTTFDEIYVLDLHGNSKKRESAPDGSKDENVFDIMQGVAIGIFVKRQGKSDGPAKVRHGHLWGKRDTKYEWLGKRSVPDSSWTELAPTSPHYLFTEQDVDMAAEYEQGWKITDIFPINSAGIVTARDALSIHWDEADIWDTVQNFIALKPEEARERFDLGRDTRDWKVDLAQKDLKRTGPNRKHLCRILYRPFDVRHTYYTGQSRGFHCMPRGEVMEHMIQGKNLGMVCTRQTKDDWGVLASDMLIGHKAFAAFDINSLFPLYLYQIEDHGHLFGAEAVSGNDGRRPNLSADFITDFSTRLKLAFVPDGKGDRSTTFGPEDVFAYAYAIFHMPSYRSRYAEFLKIDFPRLPLTHDAELFRKFCTLGDELMGLHLMERQGPKLPGFPFRGSNEVDKVHYTEPADGVPGRVWINSDQCFEGVAPEVWDFHMGGYQVAQKWLKDRKGRTLTHDDLTHYRQIIAALSETIRLMAEVDEAIENSGGWPLQ